MPTDAPKPNVKTAPKRKAERSFEGSLSEDEEPPKKSAFSPGVKQPDTASSSDDNSSEDEEKSKPKIALKNDEIGVQKHAADALKPKMNDSSSEDEEEPKKNPEDEENLTDAREGSSPMKVSTLDRIIIIIATAFNLIF